MLRSYINLRISTELAVWCARGNAREIAGMRKSASVINVIAPRAHWLASYRIEACPSIASPAEETLNKKRKSKHHHIVSAVKAYGESMFKEKEAPACASENAIVAGRLSIFARVKCAHEIVAKTNKAAGRRESVVSALGVYIFKAARPS